MASGDQLMCSTTSTPTASTQTQAKSQSSVVMPGLLSPILPMSPTAAPTLPDQAGQTDWMTSIWPQWQDPLWPLSPAPPLLAPSTPATPTTTATPATTPADPSQTAATPPTTQTPPATTNPTTDPQAQTPPEPDPKKISAAANNLFKAMDGLGTDESAVHNAMRGMNAAEIAALKREYQDHFGRDLMSDIRDEMSGEDLEEAEAMLTADPVQSAVAQLNNAANGGLFGWGTDEAKINDVLSKLPDEATRKKVAEEYEKKTGTKLDQMLQDELSSYDLDQSKALLSGDKTSAAAIKLDQAMNGGLFGWGTDEKGVYDALAGCKTKEERDAMAKAYKDRTGEDLGAAFGREMSGAEKDVADSMLAGNEAAAAAAKIKVAAEGWGTDEQSIYKEFENITASEKDPVKAKAKRDALIAAYNEKYGDSKNGGESFDQMIGSEFSGMDREKAAMLAQEGKLSDTFALNYAMNSGPLGGLGTDEALLRTTLEGKTAEQIAKIKADYRQAYGRELTDDIGGEVDGRDGFEIGQMLKGKPTTPQEMADRANEAWEFERGSGSSWLSNGVMDIFSNRGAVLDMQHARIQETFEKSKADGAIDPAEAKRVEQLFGWQGQDVKNYQEAKDSVANTTATVATIAAAAALTAASGGTGAPALVAALSGMGASTTVASGLAVGGIALASGVVGQGAKWAMLGDSYGAQDAQIDFAKNALNAVTAGVGKGLEPGISNFLGIAAKEQGKIPLTFLEGFQKSVLTDGFTNMSGALINTAFDEKAYQGDDFLGVLGKNLAMGAVTTGMGAVGKGLSTPVSDLVGIQRQASGSFAPATLMQTIAKDGILGGLGGMGSGVTSALFDPSSWNTAGGFFGNMLEKGGMGLLSGGLSKAASGGIDSLMGSSTSSPQLWGLLKGGLKSTAETGISNAFNPAAWTGDQAKQWLTAMLPAVLKGSTGDANKARGDVTKARLAAESAAANAGSTPPTTETPPATQNPPAATQTPPASTPTAAAVSAPTRELFPNSPLVDDAAVMERLGR